MQLDFIQQLVANVQRALTPCQALCQVLREKRSKTPYLHPEETHWKMVGTCFVSFVIINFIIKRHVLQ